MYQTLTDYLSEIEKNTSNDWTVHGEEPVPYIEYIPLVGDFEEEIYNFVESHPEYGLGKYQYILRANGISGGIESIKNADVSKMDDKSVLALLVWAARAERYLTASWLDLFESGAVKKWLLRLREIDN